MGAGILGSSQAGWLLFLAHSAASLTVGLIFRFYKYSDAPMKQEAAGRSAVVRLPAAFSVSVKSSFQSVFYICAFIMFFTVVIQLLYVSGVLPGLAKGLAALAKPLGASPALMQDLLTGLIEITSGLWSLEGSASAQLVGKMAMAAFMLGWAGLSVHCQVLSFIGQSGLTPWTYIGGKLLHGLISAVYAYILATFTGLGASVQTIVAGQVETLATIRFGDTLTMTLVSIAAVLVCMALLGAAVLMKKVRQ